MVRDYLPYLIMPTSALASLTDTLEKNSLT